MATEIRVPTLGESVTEATIGKWFKSAGDPIAVDEPLVELETDMVTFAVPAPSAGTLAEIAAKEGETVEVGALLGSIAEGGGKATPAAKPAGEKQAGEKPQAVSQAAGASAAGSTGEAAAKTARVAGQEPIEERAMPPAPSAA
jgi:2-oxoglutarate dehydrogenase E2 component (dihydrolipoamide succinyltransferase)